MGARTAGYGYKPIKKFTSFKMPVINVHNVLVNNIPIPLLDCLNHLEYCNWEDICALIQNT